MKLQTLLITAIIALTPAFAAKPATSKLFNTIGRGYQTVAKATHIVHPIPELVNDTLGSNIDSSIPGAISECAQGNANRDFSDSLTVSLPLANITVTSPFGVRRDPFTGKRRQHNGLDLRARNEKVFAMLDGKIHKTGENKRAGKFVTLQHGDYTVTYCHLSRVLVLSGDIIHAGDLVAISGNTGRSSNAHLHITMKCGQTYLNPAILLSYIKTLENEQAKHMRNA